MRTLFLRLAPLLGVFFFGSVLAQDGSFTGAEIEKSWVGKELIATTGNGAKVSLKLEVSGKASVNVGGTSDTGIWRATENGYCATWQKIRAGQERCFTVTRSGNAFKVINPDGSLSANITDIK